MLKEDDDLDFSNVHITSQDLERLDDLDLDKELGLEDQPSASSPSQPPPPYPKDEKSAAPQPAPAQKSGWWSDVWSGAATLVSTASSVTTNPDLSKAVWSATEKAAAAVSSINESYKITEGLASVATLVEKKGNDLKNVTLASVDKILDVIDPIETESNLLYTPEVFDQAGPETKIKVVVTSPQAVEIVSVINVFERVYGAENVLARGISIESGYAKQSIGFEAGLVAAQQKIDNLLALDTFKEKKELLIVSIENFISDIGGEWFDFHAVVVYDRLNEVKAKGFSQGISLPADIAEKVVSLTPQDYPFKQFGASVTVASVVATTFPELVESGWYLNRTDGRIDKALILENAVSAVCGTYWSKMRQQNLLGAED